MRSLRDLAAAIASRSDGGRVARLALQPETATRVVAAIAAFEALPNRDDVVKVICRESCGPERRTSCYPCIGRANLIDRLYKGGDDPFGGAPKGRIAALQPENGGPSLRLVEKKSA